MYYVNERWLGGMLTNYKTISGRIKRLNDIKDYGRRRNFRKAFKEGSYQAQSWKLKSLEKFLGGIKDMKGMPGAYLRCRP